MAEFNVMLGLLPRRWSALVVIYRSGSVVDVVHKPGDPVPPHLCIGWDNPVHVPQLEVHVITKHTAERLYVHLHLYIQHHYLYKALAAGPMGPCFVVVGGEAEGAGVELERGWLHGRPACSRLRW